MTHDFRLLFACCAPKMSTFGHADELERVAMKTRKKALALLMLFGFFATGSRAQDVPLPQDSGGTLREWNERILEVGRGGRGPQAPPDYRIGAEDLIEVSVFEVPELSRTVRVSAGGEISLPLVGTVRAAGLSPLELEQVLTELLRRTYIKEPQVTVFLKEFKSDPVSVVGAVKVPGLYYIQTQKTLIEVLAMAQGFSEGPQRLPGRTILISRRSGRSSEKDLPFVDPGPSGVVPLDAKGASGSVEIPIKELLQGQDPKWNVSIYPGDVVRVALAGTFYVAGEVNRPGGFVLTDFENISVLQALAMAGGTKRSASSKNALVIRRDAAGNRVEEKINLKRVLKGQDREAVLGANDILFVPGSASKESALRAIESSIQMATGILVWRIP